MGLIPKELSDLAGQGTGWLLFCVTVGAFVWLLRKHLALLEANSELAKVVALSMRENGEAVGSMAQAVRDRTPAFDALSQVVMQQARDYETNNKAWEGWAARHDTATKEIHDEQIEVRRLLDKREGRA